MSRKDKLLGRAKQNSNRLRFDDFETLLRLCGWTFDRQTGSHRIWYSPKRYRLSIQEARDGKAKGYQVRQFLEQYNREITDEK